jgi:hypothetical protein
MSDFPLGQLEILDVRIEQETRLNLGSSDRVRAKLTGTDVLGQGMAIVVLGLIKTLGTEVPTLRYVSQSAGTLPSTLVVSVQCQRVRPS